MAIVVTNSGDQDSALPEKRVPPSYPVTEEAIPPPSDPSNSPHRLQPARAGGLAERRGFFTIYKKGQGFWTRMGTVAAAALIGR